MRCAKLALSATLLVGAATPAAAQLDLAAPAPALSFLSGGIGWGDRGVVFDALTSFTIFSAGVRLNPMETTALQVDIYSHEGAEPGMIGPRIATASTPIALNGLGFYDVNINFTFDAGSRYYVAFRDANEDWGYGRNQMEFYTFDYGASASYTVGGQVRVLDGCAYNLGSGCANTVMPHIRFSTTPPEFTPFNEVEEFDGGPIRIVNNSQTVPEPSTYVLLAAGLAGIAAVARRRTPSTN